MKHTFFLASSLKEREEMKERENDEREREGEGEQERARSSDWKNALRTTSSHTRARHQHRINNKFNNKAHTIYKCTSYTWHIASTMAFCLLPTSLSHFRFNLIFVYCVCWWCICIWWLVAFFSRFRSLSHAHRIKVLLLLWYLLLLLLLLLLFSNRNQADERPAERPKQKKPAMSNSNHVSVAV